jgi:hypothetical protein
MLRAKKRARSEMVPVAHAGDGRATGGRWGTA